MIRPAASSSDPIDRRDAARLVDFYDRMRTSPASPTPTDASATSWTGETEHTRDAIDRVVHCSRAARSHGACCGAIPSRSRCRSGMRESLPARYVAGAGDDLGLPRPGRRFRSLRQGAAVREGESVSRSQSHRAACGPTSSSSPQSERAHATTDWPTLTARVLALGAGHVIVVGPFPAWRPSLPRVYAANHLERSRRVHRHRS